MNHFPLFTGAPDRGPARTPHRMIAGWLARCVLAMLCGFAALASGQTINPADYGNVTLHLKADALVQANNSAVTAWGPTSASGANSPTYIAADTRFNNRPVVRFDGVDDVLKWAATDLRAQTIFAVVTLESAAGGLAGLFSTGADKLNVRRDSGGFYRSIGHAADANDFIFNAPSGNLYVNNVLSGAFTTGVPHLMMAVAGGQKSYAPFWIGSASTALGRYWAGSIAEIIIFDGPLTALGLDRVGWYLQNKYNLPTTFPTPLPTIPAFNAALPGGLSSATGVLSTAGSPVTLSWNVQGATSLAIDQGVLAATATASGSATVSPTATTTYTLTATNSAGSITKAITVHIGASTLPPRLNEFLADSSGPLLDEDGAPSDWIEIYNPNPFAVDLAGCRLEDSGAQWTFPQGSAIEANGYRVVFASGKNRLNPASPLHTNFLLNTSGEYLALRSANGAIATEFAPAYASQREGVSFGPGAASTPVYFKTPTPGAANSAGVLGFVGDTNFSVKRGFYTAPIQVAIATATPGATIRYTLDSSTPTAATGTLYSGAITISSTTTLRARAFLDGYEPSNADTQTYLFLADVVNQVYPSTPPAGWPATGLNGQALRYGWNTSIKSQYSNQQVIDSLKQVPTISIVTDQRNLTDAVTGIYVNALEKSEAWERPASVEFIQPDGSAGFNINAGLRIRGGYSRNDAYAKHSLRLYFRSSYGTSKLKFPLHGPGGTDEFESIDLRSEQNYYWGNDTGTQNTAVREVFTRDLMAALGQPTTRSRYVQLYLNGQYWGLFQTEERAQQDYGASYFGGDSADYDVLQTSNHPNFTYEVSSGTVAAWQTLWNMARAHAASPTNANFFAILGKNASGVRIPTMPVYLDLDNLISYMLLYYYTGDGDAPLSNFLGMNQANNWRGMRSRVTDAGFRFFVHDGEHTLQAGSWVDNRANTAAPSGSNRSNFTYSNPEWIHEDLSANAEYRIRFADFAQKFLFNNGPMVATVAQPLFDARAAQINQAIIADAARWGTNSTNHTLAQWQARLAAIRTGFFPGRAAALLGHLRTRGFFPAVNAPTFAKRGGQVSLGYKLFLSAGTQTGTVYYTLDGSDPRALGGAIAGTAYDPSGIAINGPGTVRARFRDTTGTWSALDEAYFSTLAPAAAGNLIISKLNYHPTDPSASELAAGYNSASDFEYLELTNIGAEPVDLRGVNFTLGVTFNFTSGATQSLAAGASFIVSGNAAAFAARYGNGLPVAGTFSGDLKNSGELVRLADSTGATIEQFTYSDTAPWPASADGQGFALARKLPPANPDLPTSWRASYAPGGKPGGVDQLIIADWRTLHFTAAQLGNPALESTLWGNLADADNDGLSNVAEFILGGSPVDGRSLPTPTVSTWTDPNTGLQYLRLTCIVAEGTTGAVISASASDNLVNWPSNAPATGPAVSRGDGTAVLTFQDPLPMGNSPGTRRFLRANIQAN